MTTTAMTTSALDIVSECGGSSVQTADLMIGVGLVKDSEAVYFQYLGDGQEAALVQASGKPVDRIGNVHLVSLTVADDVYADSGFSGNKLNLMLESQQGRSILMTSGLTTIWSQCLVTSLMGAYAANALDHLLTISTWKGNSKMRPCFASVFDGRVKLTDNETYQALVDARGDRDSAKIERIIRDSIDVINAALTGGEVLPAEVKQLDDEEMPLSLIHI